MDEDKYVNLRIQFPRHLSNEEVYEILDKIKAFVEKEVDLDPFDPFGSTLLFDADWEDEDGTNYWNP